MVQTKKGNYDKPCLRYQSKTSCIWKEINDRSFGDNTKATENVKAFFSNAILPLDETLGDG